MGEPNVNRFCNEHGMCVQKINQNIKDIEIINDKMAKMQEDFVEQKMTIVENNGKILVLMQDMKDIKKYLKEISDKINKPDTFSKVIMDVGIEIFKWAMIVGMFVYASKIIK